MIKYCYCFLFGLLFLSLESISQEQESEQKTVSVTKITIIEPGLSHEFPAGRSQTLFIRGGLTATLATDYYDQINGVLFRLFGSTSYRVYYNFEKRKLQEKNIAKNSANYFALLVLVGSQPLNKGGEYDPELNNGLLNTGIVWGFQRNYPSHFSLDLNIGLGYVKAGTVNGISPIGELNIGFWLGKKK